MKTITNKIVDGWVRKQIIKAEDAEYYYYGLYEGIILIFNFISIIIVGLITNMLLESVLFSVFYMSLKAFAGGSHQKTHLKCYIVSLLILFSALITMNFFSMSNLYMLSCMAIALIISTAIYLKLAPVDNINKPLDELEIKIYRKKAIMRLIILLVVTIIALIMQSELIFETSSFSIIFIVISMLRGKFNN